LSNAKKSGGLVFQDRLMGIFLFDFVVHVVAAALSLLVSSNILTSVHFIC